MEREREIYFVRLEKGVGHSTNKPWFRIDYVIDNKWIMKSDFITALDYDRINKKVGDKHMQKCTAVLGINDYDRVVIVDIK